MAAADREGKTAFACVQSLELADAAFVPAQLRAGLARQVRRRAVENLAAKGVTSIDHVAGLGGLDPEHGEVFDGFFFEGVDEAFGDEFLRDQVNGEAVFVDLLGGAVADGGDAWVAETAGVREG